jgi:hypothetical protein
LTKKGVKALRKARARVEEIEAIMLGDALPAEINTSPPG